MTKPSVILLGAGGHARSCIDVIEQEGKFAISGLVGLRSEVGTEILGYPVLGTDGELPALLRQHRRALVTIGQIKNPEIRVWMFKQIQSSGCEAPIIVSPRAYVSRHATVGAGTIVLHGAIVNASASIGANCIINSQALIEHDSAIDDHCHIATAVAINSGVRVGRGTFIGSQSSVRESVIIGERCVIGMGARVLHDCAAGSTILTRPGQS